jgi:hypothetical protein
MGVSRLAGGSLSALLSRTAEESFLLKGILMNKGVAWEIRL